MERKDTIGHGLAKTHHLVGQIVNINSNNMSPIQIGIIRYLYNHRDDRVYQKDIENLFYIRRSTVTGILNNMEKNNIIYRTTSLDDTRCKIVHLTSDYLIKAKDIVSTSDSIDEVIERGLTDGEKKKFLSILDKIQNNLREEERRLKNV